MYYASSYQVMVLGLDRIVLATHTVLSKQLLVDQSGLPMLTRGIFSVSDMKRKAIERFSDLWIEIFGLAWYLWSVMA